MAKSGALKRPTRIMQEAVNMHLEGKTAEAIKHLKTEEHAQHTKENLERFVEIRKSKGLGPYTFERKPRGSKALAVEGDDILSTIDGRTKVATLIRLENRVRELLAEKDQKEVTKVRDAMKNYEKLKQQLEEAQNLLF